MAYDYDILFIGAGPAGYVGAIRASQLGLRTAVMEREKLGGVCLNIGCIPSKALIEQASRFHTLGDLENLGVKTDLSHFEYAKVQELSRKAADRLSKGVAYLLKKNGIESILGDGHPIDAHRVECKDTEGTVRTISTESLVIATGSRPRVIPPFQFDGKRVLSSTDLLMLKELPKRLAILGAGAIGMEFAYIMNAFGVSVEVVELMDRVLPMEVPEASTLVRKAFEKRGVSFRTSTKAVGLETKDDGSVQISLSPAQGEGRQDTLEADALLVAIGRTPNTDGLGLEELGVRLDRGYMRVYDYYESSAAGIYGVGDIVAGEAQLAHVASAQAELVAERVAYLAGKGSEPHKRRLDVNLIPQAVYCEPQVASFGQKDAEPGSYHRSSSFPFKGIGKAVAVGSDEGFVKILTDPATGEILGATVVGAEATELIHQLLLAASSELRISDVADMVHAHPTFSEGVKEAALAALGRALHI